MAFSDGGWSKPSLPQEAAMTGSLLDAAGRKRSPATMPGYLCRCSPRNKGMLYPADPPRPEEIIAVMRQAGGDRHGLRMRALIAVLWRAGLRISEALALTESDIEPARGSVLSVTARATVAAKPEWMIGASSTCSPGSSGASSCRSAQCFA
jgi:hypothetical protein